MERHSRFTVLGLGSSSKKVLGSGLGVSLRSQQTCVKSPVVEGWSL